MKPNNNRAAVCCRKVLALMRDPASGLSRLLVGLALCLPLCSMAAESAANMGQLSLAQAIDLAASYNHDLKLSALAVRSAEASRIAASAAPNPTLTVQTSNINPSLGVGSGSLRDKTVESTIRIDQLIERGGKRELRTENAMHLERASQDDLKDARRQLRLAVAQSYFDLHAAQDRLQAARETAALFDRTMDAAQKRKSAGDIAGAELDRLRVDAIRAKNDARQAEADLAAARLALAQLMGVASASASIEAVDPWPDPAEANIGNVEKVIDARPDIQAARARVNAAESARRLAQASRTRDVSVGMQFDHYPNSPTNTLGGGNSYGVSVQIPLFVRYYYEGEIRAAEAALDTARENLEKARAAALFEVNRSMHDVQAAAERVQRFQQELLAAAKRSADAAEFAFRNGAIGVMEVLDARRTYRATLLDAVAAQADYAKSLAAWRAATFSDNQQ